MPWQALRSRYGRIRDRRASAARVARALTSLVAAQIEGGAKYTFEFDADTGALRAAVNDVYYGVIATLPLGEYYPVAELYAIGDSVTLREPLHRLP